MQPVDSLMGLGDSFGAIKKAHGKNTDAQDDQGQEKETGKHPVTNRIEIKKFWHTWKSSYSIRWACLSQIGV
ncbi:hypothetical protein WSM22_32720 [Cytophagales bacterium WSM2-2]|nr:hypothetical protein WSM22_32720 [Cytophagales bacterium WSM2-2]